MRIVQRTAASLALPALTFAWLLAACDADVTIPPPPPDGGADAASGDVTGPDGGADAASDAAVDGPHADAPAEAAASTDAEAGVSPGGPEDAGSTVEAGQEAGFGEAAADAAGE